MCVFRLCLAGVSACQLFRKLTRLPAVWCASFCPSARICNTYTFQKHCPAAQCGAPREPKSSCARAVRRKRDPREDHGSFPDAHFRAHWEHVVDVFAPQVVKEILDGITDALQGLMVWHVMKGNPSCGDHDYSRASH